MLVERTADPLGDAAVHLAVDDHGVDDRAAVLDDDIAEDARVTRLGIDLDVRGVHGAREAARVRRLVAARRLEAGLDARREQMRLMVGAARQDRKSTRLNSSHANISYAVFCLKKKK